MNKKIILSTIALASVLTACDDDYMDQFKTEYKPTDVKALNITLEKSDYSAIAANQTNQEIALAKDPENGTFVTYLNEAGKKGYFSENAPADKYIPAWLAKKYFNADEGSTFKVTYNMERQPSAYMADFAGSIASYQLSQEDYEGVWGDKVKASFITPQTKSKVADILKEKSNGAVAGNLALVSYAYSEVEPSIGGGSEPEPENPYNTIAEAFTGAAGEYFVKGTVTATYANGFVVTDETGSILVYEYDKNVKASTSNYSIGDVVEVKGTTSKYSGFMQFGTQPEVKYIEHKKDVKYPEPTVMDGAALTAWCSNASFKYVKVTGKYEISGTYHNLTIEGTGARAGSISYPVAGVIDPSLNGKEVDLVGYLSGYSAKYIYFMATSVVEHGAANDFTPVGIVANSEAGEYKTRGVVSETYARGFLLTDGTGSILVYKSGTGAKVGDQVTVSGKTSAYAGLMQYPAASEVAIVAEGSFNKPVPTALAGADFDAYVAAPRCAYVTYTGTLSISGSYYNVAIDGTSVQGSLSYPNEGSVSADLNGQKVVVTGYAIGQTSSGKYLNTMVTSVTAAPASARMLAAASPSIQPNTSALYQFDGSAWKEYSCKDAQVAVFTQKDYEKLGALTVGAPEVVLPKYLSEKFPYIVDDANAVVVYTNAKGTIVAADYEIKNGVWAPVPDYVSETATFSLEDGVISANVSSFYESTLLGEDGGFTAQDVVKGEGLNYVWANSAQYGWKASAYVSKTNIPSESWLVSPKISLKKAKKPVLTFDEVYQYTNGATPETYLSLMISTDYVDDVTKATWNNLAIPTWSSGADWNFVNIGYIDLADFADKNITIAFVYKSDASTAPTWEFKNIKVIEMPEEAE